MSSNIEDANASEIEVSDITSNVIEDKGNKTELDTDLYYHYIVLAKKLYPDVDLHLIEYSIACHLIYDIRGEKKPEENTPEFIRATERIKQLIEDTRKLTKEMMTSEEQDKKEEQQPETEVIEE
jgi:hypothetical protein